MNTLFLAVFSYGRGIAGRQVPGRRFPITASRSTTPVTAEATSRRFLVGSFLSSRERAVHVSVEHSKLKFVALRAELKLHATATQQAHPNRPPYLYREVKGRR